MTEERSVFGQFHFGNPTRAEQEEKTLRYVIERINEDTAPHGVLQEADVQRNGSQAEIDEIIDHHRISEGA
jgi:inorganic pyrophosphatase/exopolyphosphatase